MGPSNVHTCSASLPFPVASRGGVRANRGIKRIEPNQSRRSIGNIGGFARTHAHITTTPRPRNSTSQQPCNRCRCYVVFSPMKKTSPPPCLPIWQYVGHPPTLSVYSCCMYMKTACGPPFLSLFLPAMEPSRVAGCGMKGRLLDFAACMLICRAQTLWRYFRPTTGERTARRTDE